MREVRGKANGRDAGLDAAELLVGSELRLGTQLIDSRSRARKLAPRVMGLAAILWIAGGAFVQQRPLARVQTEARIIQMAGQAVARRSEEKKKVDERAAPPTEAQGAATKTGRMVSRRIVVSPIVVSRHIVVSRIVVSIADRKLALIEGDGAVRKIYDVAVGAAETPSPEGEFVIASRVENPSWYWPGKIIPAGPQNPLGPRWMGLGFEGFGIHGTNQPHSIGQPASHGCIRMRNRDVKELFVRVRVGDVVEIHGEHDAAVALIFGSRPELDAPARVAAGGAGTSLPGGTDGGSGAGSGNDWGGASSSASGSASRASLPTATRTWAPDGNLTIAAAAGAVHE